MRHGPTQAFGIICSPTANSTFDGRLAFVPGWEDVLVWDVKRGEMVSMWHSPSHTSPVTHLLPAPSPSTSTSAQPQTFAVAYTDGSIRLWSYASGDPEAAEIVTFNGHKKSVTSLAWDGQGTRLASGGTEGEIVIWDRVGEVGLFRLRGHRAPVTSIHFVPHPSRRHPGYLVTTSKDTYLKLWDLGTQHCVQTVVVGRGEVWSSAVREERDEDDEAGGRWLVLTGSGDGEVKAWTIDRQELEEGLKENDKGELPTLVRPLCTLPLPPSTQPVSQIACHPTLPLILAQTSDRTTSVLRLRTEEEVAAKRARRKKREREKGKKKGAADAEEAADPAAEEVKWEERVTTWCVVRANAKVKSFSLAPEDAAKGASLLLALSNNSLETYTIPTPLTSTRKASKLADGTAPEPSKTHSIELPGHRQDIRALCVSSDDQVIASASSGTLKVWNARTTACLRTVECGYAICATFLPGDRHVVVGTKAGELLLYDVAASQLLATYQAHKGPVWGIHVRPDGRGLVSGSADKDVKFWDFEMRDEGAGERVVSRLGVETIYKTKQLVLVHVRTLKMTDDVLAVKYSPDGRFLAVSLLDSTVKIFFQDTLKFFLSLYGHKLPVLSLDISSDSKLIVTCSADKNVKIWGLDFGDCHKSIFAHDDSVMQVAFEKNSHYFWTVGKDRLLKYWDGDKFELIQKLEGHHGEVWALAVSNQGTFVVSGSHDKSIRIWEKTDEPLFLEEERERELEAAYDAHLADTLNRDPDVEGDGGPGADGVEAVQKQTAESLMAGEKIMEALEVADADRAAQAEYEAEKARLGDKGEALPAPPKSAELLARGGIEGDEHVYQTLKKIPAAQMEDALLVLPFRQVVSLLNYLDEWATKDRDIILTARLLHFLVRTHQAQIVANRLMRARLVSLRGNVRAAINAHRERMGYNIAALRFLKSRWDAENTAGMLEEEGLDEDKVRKRVEEGRTKRKRVEVRA
ncbi:beta transducin [Cryptotrichosporon argae]